MKDLISRSEVMQALARYLYINATDELIKVTCNNKLWRKKGFEITTLDIFKNVGDMIANIPSETITKAHWIHKEIYGDEYVCSFCHSGAEMPNAKFLGELDRYCKYCGSKMEREYKYD